MLNSIPIMKMMTNLPKILIVGTLPYNPQESSRALDTYFRNYPKDKLRMIYSNEKAPIKGHCESFFRITDKEMVKKFFSKKKKTGTIFNPDTLTDTYANNCSKTKPSFVSKFKKKNTLRFYLRKILWSKQRWLSDGLNEWVEEFKPDAIYICFSDDYFILDIALYFSKKFNLPIICQISDDYYFIKEKLLLRPYYKKYRKLFEEVMSTEGFAFYISDKIADKYNEFFYKKGFPIYLGSDIESKTPSIINFEFNYFGKINVGRHKSLGALNKALMKINGNFRLNIYTDEFDSSRGKYLIRNGCNVNKPISYGKVKEMMTSGSFNIIASGFDDRDVDLTKYSVSTKVADCLKSRCPLIAIGSKKDGAIDYLKDKNCCIVLDNPNIDIEKLEQTLNDADKLKMYIENAYCLFENNHLFEVNNKKFMDACRHLIKENENE